MNTTRISLIGLLQAGDPNGWDRFTHLYRRHIDFWAKKNGTADQDFDDVCQQVYRVMVEKIDEFQSRERKGSFRCWLKSITRFVCLEQKRKQGGPTTGKGGTEAAIQLKNFADPDQDYYEDEPDPVELDNDLFRRAINLVRSESSSRDWSVVEMVVIEGKSPNDIADALNLKPATVRKIKSRFLLHLRKELGGYDENLSLDCS